MSFLRKMASAFVVIEDRGERPAGSGDLPVTDASLDDITQQTSSLLAQLESAPPLAAGSESPEGSVMDMTAEDAFRAAQLGDTPSSAPRVIKLVAGLSMFPRDQQLAMVRAMDAADDAWSEAEVVRDAKQRQRVLREHLTRIAQERTRRTDAINAQADEAKQGGSAVLAELDKRIAELSARREQEVLATAATLSQLEQQRRELEAREVRARQGIAQVIQALSGLLTFLGVPQGPESQ